MFYKENKNDLKNILYKLSNTERLKLQQKKGWQTNQLLSIYSVVQVGLSLGIHSK